MTDVYLDHLGITKFNGHCAIITGDPDRVLLIINLLGGGNLITDRRGFVCWKTKALESPILVVSTGIGGPSTAIVVEELIQIGIKIIVRVGSCGAIQKTLKPWNIIVATGAYRDEGTSRQYVNIEYPAIPDMLLTASIFQVFEKLSCEITSGIIHSKDAYYLEHPNKQILPRVTADHWKYLNSAGIVATEMESSTLFVIGSLRKIRTAAILISVAEKYDAKAFEKTLASVIMTIKETFTIKFPPLFLFDETSSEKRRESYLDNINKQA